MKITRRMEWPEPRDLKSLESFSEYSLLLYQTLTEESALRAVELDVPYTDGYNVFIGHEAGQSNTISLDDTEGIYNVFIGHQAGYSNTTGIKNIAIGYKPLYTNTTGYENIAVGHQALTANTEGFRNVAIGSEALISNTTGDLNVAVGYRALYNAQLPDGNIAVGFRAMGLGIVTGIDNVAVGKQALYDLTAGFGNIAIGTTALLNVTTGDQNIAIGYLALEDLVTGNQNVAIGYEASSNCLGSGNIFIGYQSGLNETGSNTLYISNSSTATPLIGGVFPNTSLTFTSAATTFSGTIASADITVDSKLVLSAGSITDGDGAISFGNEALSTTGTVACNVLTVDSGTTDLASTFHSTDDKAYVQISDDDTTFNLISRNLDFSIGVGIIHADNVLKIEGDTSLVTLKGNLTLLSATSTITGGTKLTINAGTSGVCSQTIYGDSTASAANMNIGNDPWQIKFSSSSKKFKNEIQNLELDSALIYGLRPVSFSSLCKGDNKNRRFIGLIAEEIEKICPDIINYDDNEEAISYDNQMLMTLILSEVQKQNQRIEALEAA